MSTKFLSPGWRMPRNANQSKSSNYSMDFDATNQSVIVSSNNVFNFRTGDFTLSAWIKVDSFGSGYYPYILDFRSNGHIFNENAVAFYLDSNGILQVWIDNSLKIGSSGTALVANTWYNVILKRESGTLSTHINGGSADQTASYAGDMNTTPPLTIGARAGNTQAINGQIDAVSIFNYALSSSQINTLQGSSSTGIGNPMSLSPKPIAYYPLGTSAYNGEYLAENNAIGDYVFDFDGSNDYVQCSTLTDYDDGDFSVSIWLYRESGAVYGRVIGNSTASSRKGFDIYTINNNVAFTRRTPTKQAATGNVNISYNTWHNIIGTYNDSTGDIKLYLDGVLKITASATSDNNANSSVELTMGTTATVPYIDFLNGKLSNAQIFNTVLPATDVETLYNYGSPIRTLANIPQSSNLKAWYKLDASEVYNNTTTEWSIDNNQNPSAYASSLDFDGVDDYIDCGDTDYLNGVTQMSLSVWFNFDTAISTRGLIGDMQSVNFNSVNGHFHIITKNASGNDYSFRIYFIDTDSLQHSIDIDNRPFTAGQWHNLVMTYNSGTVNFYADGSLAPSTIFSGTIPSSFVTLTNNKPLEIGRWSTVEWDGKISNASIWNTELTSTQVTELYNNGTPSNLLNHSVTSNLVSWYKLNNTTTGIEDAKGSNNGTNNGATEYTGFVNKLVGDSSGMSQANLVQSDLQTVAPYSKYAMNFDAASTSYVNVGNDSSLNLTSQMSVSIWAKPTGTAQDVYSIISNFPQTYKFSFYYYRANSASSRILILRINASGSSNPARFDTYVDLSDGNWHHLAFTVDGTTNANGINVYVDGAKLGSFTASEPGINSNSSDTLIGAYITNSTWDFDGYLSNASIWDTALTEAQITEIYNEGLPSNLNSHSAYSNLVSWWQLGENSSFDGNNWICADEKGTNNGTSTGMSVGALVNGVGTTANGVSSGMSEGNLVGDAPYSTANALSTNMVVTSRVTGSGNTP